MTAASAGSQHNKRQHARVEHSVPIWVLERSPGENLLGSAVNIAMCKNVSQGGACIYALRRLTASTIYLRFEVPNGAFVSNVATVVREVKIKDALWEYGLSFSEPLPTHVMDCVGRQISQRTQRAAM